MFSLYFNGSHRKETPLESGYSKSTPDIFTWLDRLRGKMDSNHNAPKDILTKKVFILRDTYKHL